MVRFGDLGPWISLGSGDMTTGHSPSSGDYDATMAASRFASPQDLERIAQARPDLHSILAANPSIPPQVLSVLERSDDDVVQEILARRTGQGASQSAGMTPPAWPGQPQIPGQIDAMAPTMAVAPQPQQASGYGAAPQGYDGAPPTAPGAMAPGAAPQGYGYGTGAGPQPSPLPQDSSQAAQPVALPPPSQHYSAPSMQSAAQPMEQQPAMPPGVPAGAPPGYMQGQSQITAPAYGAPMYSPTIQPPKRRGLKVLAIVLPIVLLLTGGGVAAWYFFGSSSTSVVTFRTSLIDSWGQGAQESWSVDVASDAEPYVIGDYFLTYEKSSNTLTGYSSLDKGMEESWRVELADDVYQSSYSSFSPSFQNWGNSRLIYRHQMIDLKTGKESSPPWGKEDSAVIAGGVAVSCNSDDRCTAWESPSKKRWSKTIKGAKEFAKQSAVSNTEILTRGGKEYTAFCNIVIDLRTGDTIHLGKKGEVSKDTAVVYIKDGWLLYSKDETSSEDNLKWDVTVYDTQGSKKSSYTIKPSEGKDPVFPNNTLLTAEQHQKYFSEREYDEAPLTISRDSSGGCVSKLTPKNGQSFSAPTSTKHSSSSDDDDTPCPTYASISSQGSIVSLTAWEHSDPNSALLLMNTRTGKEIKFKEIDWKSGDSLIMAEYDLIIGYDKEHGKAIGFKPES